MEKPPYLTAAFYRFVDLRDCEARRTALLAVCNRLGLRGLILLAREGINGTIAGAPEVCTACWPFCAATRHWQVCNARNPMPAGRPFCG